MIPAPSIIKPRKPRRKNLRRDDIPGRLEREYARWFQGTSNPYGIARLGRVRRGRANQRLIAPRAPASGVQQPSAGQK
jgi:hypothetical protein